MIKEKSNKKGKSLETFKKEYSILKNKYNLPDFDYLNKDFQIEKLSEIETDFLVKEIRKLMIEKLFDYLKFIESLINPIAESPLFVLNLLKKITPEIKEKLLKIYERISSLEFEIIKLDLDYSEKEEAKSIIKYYNLWQEIKKELKEIISFLEENTNPLNNKSKTYLG
jgi:hypothetical protein